MVEKIIALWSRVREQRPLVHHITNMVVMNDTANITLALGGLPVMAHAKEEVAEMVGAAGVLILNPGTLTPYWIDSMLIAGKRANELGIPVVLDPVGAGATQLRTESCLRLLNELKITVVRGNSGEVGALAGMGGVVKGVESVVEVDNPADVAGALARQYKLTAVITGKRDFISDGERTICVDNGDPWLKTITGTGCMSTTVVGACAAVERDPVLAATSALVGYGIAAELAGVRASGPGTFKVALFDEVYNLTAEKIRDKARVVVL
jgi:hydroxyethylthiazole kinase